MTCPFSVAIYVDSKQTYILTNSELNIKITDTKYSDCYFIEKIYELKRDFKKYDHYYMQYFIPFILSIIKNKKLDQMNIVISLSECLESDFSNIKQNIYEQTNIKVVLITDITALCLHIGWVNFLKNDKKYKDILVYIFDYNYLKIIEIEISNQNIIKIKNNKEIPAFGEYQYNCQLSENLKNIKINNMKQIYEENSAELSTEIKDILKVTKNNFLKKLLDEIILLNIDLKCINSIIFIGNIFSSNTIKNTNYFYNKNLKFLNYKTYFLLGASLNAFSNTISHNLINYPSKLYNHVCKTYGIVLIDNTYEFINENCIIPHKVTLIIRYNNEILDFYKYNHKTHKIMNKIGRTHARVKCFSKKKTNYNYVNLDLKFDNIDENNFFDNLYKFIFYVNKNRHIFVIIKKFENDKIVFKKLFLNDTF